MPNTYDANSIIACVDGSEYTHAVLEAAIWSAKQLHAPIGLLHAHDKKNQQTPHDYSGSIGFGSREHLLDALAKVDAERNTIIREHGKVLLTEAKKYTQEQCQQPVFKVHRHETLKNSIKNLQKDVQMLVLGQKGGDLHAPAEHVGGQLETAIRMAHCPVLVVTEYFRPPKSALYAFDNRPNSIQGLKWLAEHPMFTKVNIHIVMVAEETDETKENLRAGAAKLKQNGLNVTSKLIQGDPKTALTAYQQAEDLDILIMGAYGHSRLHEFLMGSTTQALLKNNLKSLLMMRF